MLRALLFETMYGLYFVSKVIIIQSKHVSGQSVCVRVCAVRESVVCPSDIMKISVWLCVLYSNVSKEKAEATRV